MALPRITRLRRGDAGQPLRRRGLGAAVCAFALGRLYEEGGRQAIVYCISDRACELYKSLGFRIHATIVEYRRARAED